MGAPPISWRVPPFHGGAPISWGRPPFHGGAPPFHGGAPISGYFFVNILGYLLGYFSFYRFIVLSFSRFKGPLLYVLRHLSTTMNVSQSDADLPTLGIEPNAARARVHCEGQIQRMCIARVVDDEGTRSKVHLL